MKVVRRAHMSHKILLETNILNSKITAPEKRTRNY